MKTSQFQYNSGRSYYFGESEVPEKTAIDPRRYDFIIYGATGLAGRQTINEALRVLKNYNWAIAGRNAEKVNETLEDIGYHGKRNLSGIPVLEAAIDDHNSLLEMVSCCRVLLNCCGPFNLCGEAMIKACLKQGTHYIDISFEPKYVKDMYEKYHAEAIERGIYILTSCGFHSFANEIFINRIDDTFSGLVRQIDCYVQYWSLDMIQPVFTLQFWYSLLYALKYAARNLKLSENISWKRLIQRHSNDRERTTLMYKSHDVGKTVNVAWPFIEQKIFAHTQEQLGKIENKPAIKFNEYLAFPSYFYAILFFIWSVIVTFMCQIPWLHWLLAHLPGLCSFGYVSAVASKIELLHLKNLKYSVHYYVLCGEANMPLKRQNRHIVGMLNGVNPFYGFTSAALLVSGINLLNNYEIMPSCGGVYTPGVAFRNVDVMTGLREFDHLFTFQLVEVVEGGRKIWCLI